jgi:hypothetical protein
MYQIKGGICMKLITIRHYGKVYGYCYVVESNINLSNDFILGTDRFATNKRMNARMIRSSKYKAHNHLDNEKFLSKGKRLVL